MLALLFFAGQVAAQNATTTAAASITTSLELSVDGMYFHFIYKV